MSATESRKAVDIYIRLLLLSLLIFWCLSLILPFLSIVVWAIILALALSPVYNSLLPKLKNKKGLTASLLVITGVILIIVPSWLFLDSIIEAVQEMKDRFQADTLTLPPPPESVADLPVIGKKLSSSWQSASEDLQNFIIKNKQALADLGRSVINGLMGIGGSVVQFILATIIAGVLLVISGTKDVTQRIFVRLLGPKGGQFADLAQRTVNNVVKGVLGVAFIQAFILGIGFLLAGVPFAGLWALIVFILAILQIPALLVVIPVVIYLFSSLATVPAILWSVYLFLGGASDNLLKPILLGKGAPVPMLVIFLGVVGGFITMGFIGLFIGAIVLSLGYMLFVAWLEEGDPT
jgi:predicted PurR-regulated permease PerM